MSKYALRKSHAAGEHSTRRGTALNRRAFLRGTAGVTLGLPFLEGIPERSAWAEGEAPVFSLFVCAVDGVIPEKFFPDSPGPLSVEGLREAGKATSELAVFADNLLFLDGIGWPMSPLSDPHAEGLCMALTARTPMGSGNNALASGPSADFVIGSKVHPAETSPLVLYAGNLRNGYIAERISFSGPGERIPALDNPYVLYKQLIGIAGPDGSANSESAEAEWLLAERQNSANDLVREQLNELLANSRLSAADRRKLQQHLDAIRDTEIRMGEMGLASQCSAVGLDTSKLASFENFVYSRHGIVEDMAQLHLSLVALAFACNYRRTASLQWGDGTDQTIYDVPANRELGGWPFNHICHRVQSDSGSGENPLAEQAHAEIDVVRMKSLAVGLEHFHARGLAEHACVLWTNGFRDCPVHSYRSVPHIIWGNGGGFLQQATHVDCGNLTNNQLLSTLISAAIQDTGEIVTDFGEGTPGLLDAILA